MIKKTIKYTDFNGEEQTKDFYFNLSRAELVKFDLAEGGLDDKLKAIVAAKDNKEIMRLFEEIIESSVGVKSDDGQQFIKNATQRDAFMQSEAYTELLLELMADETATKASAFVNALVPNLPQQNAKPLQSV